MHRVSRYEISKRQTSAALFPLGCYCLFVVLLAACCCAWPLAAAALLLSCCGPRHAGVLYCPLPLGACWKCRCLRRFGLCLRCSWQRASWPAAQFRMHGPRPGATPHFRHAPGAVATALADTGHGVRVWLVAAAEYQQGPAGHMCMHVKTGMHMRPGQGPAWSCIYCKRLASLPSQSTSTGRPGQQVVQVAGVHPKAPPDLPQAPGHPPGYGI